MFKPLRDKILELAITGKLVPQLDSEPAVEQIGPAPAKDEEPFALPEKWKWVRFKFTVDCLDYKRVPVKQADRDKQAKIYDYYGATGVIDKVADFIFDGRFLLIGEDGANLISKVKNNAFIANGKYWVNNHAHVFADNGVASLDYLAHFINAISLEPYLTYSAQPKLTQGKLLSIFVPLPPLEEQRRIVAKLDDIMGNLERMDQAYTELSGPMVKHFKNLVLQQAISGQLVPQLDREPAVEQIGATPAIEDAPFAIPEKWKWVQIGNLLPFGKNATQVDPSKIPSNAWVLGLEDIESNGGLISKNRNALVSSSKNAFNAGNVLYSKMRPYLNKAIIADEDGYCTTEIFVLDVLKAVLPLDAEYLLYFLRSPYFVSYAIKSSKGQKPRLDTKLGQKALFPLPPIEEQRRIVARIEELFGDVDKLLEWQQFA